MSTLADIRDKTSQRVENVVGVLRAAGTPLTYGQISVASGCPYDALLYVLATLCEVGMVERSDVPVTRGRPKAQFRWVGDSAQALGA